MNSLQAGQLVIDTFLNSYKKVNGAFITRAELFTQIYPKYDPNILMKELGANFNISMDGQLSELTPLLDTLAEKTRGGFPSVDAFRSIFYDQLPSQFEIVKKALSESADDVGKGLVAVGDAAIVSGTIIVKLLPFITIAAVLYFAYANKSKLELK